MLPFKLVYHELYDLRLGSHVFPSQKYRLIRERLLREGFANESDFAEPESAPDEDLLLVHTADWIERFKHGKLRMDEIIRLELPYTQEIVQGFRLAAGGTILAARLALRDRIGVNIGGGFHHAYSGHGEGFCALNDVAIAIRRLQKEGLAERAMVVDCDVHHGNGTAQIFGQDPGVFTLSIHQADNYPSDKPPSNVDIHLPDGVADSEYLARLEPAYLEALEVFQPRLIVYVAGADPYYDDQLGGLELTMEGLKRRDRLVLEAAVERGIPAAVTLAGGYARIVEDTVLIHCNTIKAASEVMLSAGSVQSKA